MIRRGLEFVARIAPVIAVLVFVTSCGSGGVSGTPPVNDPSKITILPADATLYSGLPTIFSITGGTGAYIISSSNQAIVPVATTLVGTSLTVIPNPVTADTLVTLTARDTGSTPSTTVTMTVKPGTVSNTITIAPSSSACSPAICSGGDAVISTTISQGGIPLAARGVRFDVISGDLTFITSPAGQPETTALSVITTTDETGTARARVRAGTSAPNQSAIIQVTDIGSGAYQRTPVVIALATTAQSGFFTIPAAITFTGPNNQSCAVSGSSEIFAFGGTPPYLVSNTRPDAFTTNTNVIGQSGGSVRVTTTGVCVDSAVIGLTDATGRNSSVTVSNKIGTATVPTPAAFAISPTAVTLTSCTAVASVTAVGGQSGGQYAAQSNYNVIIPSVTGGLISIRRAPGSNATGITGIQVAVTDGATIKTVDVTLSGTATGACP